MSSVNGWQDNFRKRCESVGWSVERTTSNHYKVKDAKGKFIFTFPTTPGDKRSMQNTLSDAKRAGLLDLEARLKLKNERDRLQRIHADREASESVEAATAFERLTAATSATTAAASVAATADANLGDVDGVKIVAIAPATWKSPVMLKAAVLADAQELLLADDRVVYRCAKDAATLRNPAIEGICHRTYDNIGSLRSHISYHSRSYESKEVTVSVAPVVAVAAPTNKTSAVSSHSLELNVLDHALAQLQNDVQKIANSLPPLIIEIDTLRDAVRKIPIASDDVLMKAQQFDAIRGMLGKE